MHTLIAGLCLLLALIIIARKPRPVEDRQGGPIVVTKQVEPTGRVPAKHSALKVATYNVQTGKSLEGKRDCKKAAEVMRNADIVGVQEVYGAGWLNRLGLGDPQSERFAKAGNFSTLFTPTRYRWFRENRGNLILTKLPFTSWKTTMLHDQSGKSFRNMTVVNFPWQGENIIMINTHLHTGRGRLAQLKEVLQEFSIHERAILLGDFNSKSDTLELMELFESGDNHENGLDAIARAGLDLDNPNRIDWIITKGFKVTNGNMLSKGVSDHPYYCVELELLH